MGPDFTHMAANWAQNQYESGQIDSCRGELVSFTSQLMYRTGSAGCQWVLVILGELPGV